MKIAFISDRLIQTKKEIIDEWFKARGLDKLKFEAAYEHHTLLDELQKNIGEIHYALSVDEFKQKYDVDIRKYDGLLFHQSIAHQKIINSIYKDNVNLRIVLVHGDTAAKKAYYNVFTNSKKDYTEEGNFKRGNVLVCYPSIKNVEEIINHLSGK
jgi:hypothetical protein